ncbi:MAG TPA: hypothetical protein DCR40_12340 [Prolixibacteraceae bacterium]|nr:hypothetical protein [Prolixibacteraceae bacterium]
MKTKLHFMKLGTMFVLLLSIFLFSCTKEEPVNVPESEFNSELTLKNGLILPPEEIACDLIAGQNILVGQVIYSHDLTNLYVTYLVNSPWVLTELHFYAGTLAGLPLNKTAIQIGHFPYDMDDLVGNQLIIPLASLSSDDGVLTLAAHAVVVNSDQNETAWANCTYKPLIASKSFFNDRGTGLSATYALTDGPIKYKDYFTISTDRDWWCNWFGINIYQNGDEYNLQSKHYADAGKVLVSDDGNTLAVLVKGEVAGKLLQSTYLFVGSWNQLVALSGTGGGGCPNYYSFPRKKEFQESLIHDFQIPIPIKSISFKDAFGSNRWGWISSYEL